MKIHFVLKRRHNPGGVPEQQAAGSSDLNAAANEGGWNL
jgi:hypothetical protein